MKLVLDKFRESIFAANQVDNLSSSSFNILIRQTGSLWELNKFVSSTNKIVSSWKALIRSLTYRMKNKGPRMEP